MGARLMHGSVLAAVQLALQTLDLLLICGSEDVNGTTDVAGMTHIQFSGNRLTFGRATHCELFRDPGVRHRGFV